MGNYGHPSHPPLRDLWHKSEIYHLNTVELKSIEIGVWTSCSKNLHLQIKVINDNMTVIIATSIM